jgi:hypothetical protein
MKERPPIRRIAADVLNKGWGEMLTTTHLALL